MGWMQKLCEAYDVGIVSDQRNENSPLIPVGFVRKSIKYHVVLTMDGQFVSADELNEKRTDTDGKGQPPMLEIPSTPQAESRTGDKGAPYPLSENLKYLACEDESNQERFDAYMEQLKSWCEQPDAPTCLHAVYAYLSRRTLLSDLSAQPNLKLSYYKDPEKRQGEGADRKAMVCFSVQTQDANPDDLWLRTDVKESWSRYYTQHLPGEKKLCYIEGRLLPSTTNYPKVQGNAKLISAKDSIYPFQYKGRFMEDHSAACISTSVILRAHNALKWLIQRQGINKYGMIWAVWNTNGATMRPATEGNVFSSEEEEEEDDEEYEEGNEKPAIDTLEGYAQAVNKAALGYTFRLEGWNSERTNYVEILGLEAATDGRMSVTYYQECPGNDYVARLSDWQQCCCWWRYNHKRKTVEIATPTSQDIAEAIMGADAVNLAKQDSKCEKSQTKLMRQLLSQLMSCIVDSQPLPLNLVQGAFHRACNPLSFTSGKDGNWSRYAWDQSVNATCAMISCSQKRGHTPNTEVFLPELQADSRNRDYLYGRLLAVADRMEEAVLDQASRPTNAIRLTQRFAQRPFETWQMIHEKLLPAFQTAGEDAKRYQITLEEIESLFLEEDRLSQRPLCMEFLQGYSSQRQDWFKKRERGGGTPQETETAILYKMPISRSQLYGCFLAIADIIEVKASDGERFGRTNAIQMMPLLAARPYDSWGQLHNKLLPYLEKLGDRAGYYQSLIGKTEAQFSQPDRESTSPLDSGYLNGYYEMLRTFYQKTQYLWQPQDWQEDTGNSRSLWYGRMLGASEWLERRMLLIRAGGTPEDAEQHATNALRYMAAFAQKPAATWAHLKDKLKPYLRYGAERTAASALIEQLEAQLTQRGWDTNTPLNSSYLHGYYAERNKKGES